MSFDVAGAKADGYTDAEIAGELARTNKFDLAGARKDGYSYGEVISHLTSAPKAARPTAADMERQRAEAETATGRGLAGLVETAVTGISSAAAMTEGAIWGTYDAFKKGDLGSMGDVVRHITDANTYKARTPEGQAANETLQRAAGAVADANRKYVADPIAEAGYPAVAALERGVGAAAPLALGLGRGAPRARAIPEEPLRAVEGEYMPARPMTPEGQIGKPSAPTAPVSHEDVAGVLTRLKEADVPAETVKAAVDKAKTPEEALQNLETLTLGREPIASAEAPASVVVPFVDQLRAAYAAHKAANPDSGPQVGLIDLKPPEMSVEEFGQRIKALDESGAMPEDVRLMRASTSSKGPADQLVPAEGATYAAVSFDAPTPTAAAAPAPIEAVVSPAETPTLTDVSGRLTPELHQQAQDMFPAAATVENVPRTVRVFRVKDENGRIVGGFKTDAAGAIIDAQARDAEGRMSPVETSVKAPEPLDDVEMFPRVDSVAHIFAGPAALKPKVIAQDRALYRNTNASGLADMLGDETQHSIHQIFVTDNPDLALGQGINKGVQIVLRPNSVSGREHLKPGTSDMVGREYITDAFAPRAIEQVTLASQKTYQQLGGLARKRLRAFDKVANADGTLTFTRKRPNKQRGALEVKEIADAVHQAILDLRNSSAGQIYNFVAKQIWHKTVSRIRQIETPTARELADMFSPERGELRGVIEETEIQLGRWMTRLDGLIDPVRGRFGLSEKNSLEALRYLRGNTSLLPSGASSNVLRQYLDDMYAYESAVVDIGHREAYAPQVWNAKAMRKDHVGAVKFFQQVLDTTAADAESVIRRILDSDEGIYEPDLAIDRFGGQQSWTVWAQQRQQRALGGASKVAQEKARRIDIPTTMLTEAETWLVNDLEAVLSRYTRAAVRRVEYARKFGKNEDVLNQKVAQILGEYESMRATADAQQLRNLGQPRQPELIARDIYDVADAAQGKFSYFPVARNQFPGAIRAERAASNFLIMVHMGKVALASIPEFFAPAIQYGIKPLAYLRGVQYAATEAARVVDKMLTGQRHIPQTDAAVFLERLGLIYQSSLRSKQLERFGGTSTVLTSKFMHYTGLEQMTNMQRVIAADTLTRVISRYSDTLIDAKASPAAKDYAARILDELGIPPFAATEWAQAGKPAGGPFQHYYDTAIVRGVTNTIVTPNPMSRSMVYNDPIMQPFFLFQSFTNVMTNTFLKRFAKELARKDTPLSRKTGSLVGMLGAVAAAYYVLYWKANNVSAPDAQTRYENKEEGQLIWDALKATYMPAPVQSADRLLQPKTDKYGRERAMSSYDVESKMMETAFGVMGSDAAKIVAAARSDDPKLRAKTAAQLTPVLNILPATQEWETEQLMELQQ